MAVKNQLQRSKSEHFCESICIISQEPGSRMCKAEFKETRSTRISGEKKLSDKLFFNNSKK